MRRRRLDGTGKDTDDDTARDSIWCWNGLYGERLACAGEDEGAAGGGEALSVGVRHVGIKLKSKVNGCLLFTIFDFEKEQQARPYMSHMVDVMGYDPSEERTCRP